MAHRDAAWRIQVRWNEAIGDDDAVIVMSNGGFEGIHGRLVKALQQT